MIGPITALLGHSPALARSPHCIKKERRASFDGGVNCDAGVLSLPILRRDSKSVMGPASFIAEQIARFFVDVKKNFQDLVKTG
jgi:hypothetical protein